MSEEGYTIKDRIAILADTISQQFAGIITQLDKIEAKLDGKASNERVATLEKAIAVLEISMEKRITRLESRNEDGRDFSRRTLAWATIGAMIFLGSIGYLIHLATLGVH